MAFHFLNRENRRKRALAKGVMVTLSVLWMMGSILSFCVLFASVMIHGRGTERYYALLSHQLPIVTGTVSIWALITFPLATLIGLLFGWPYLHDDDYRRAIAFNLLPCLNLLALWLDSLF